MTEVQKENSSVVEQASCLFMTEVQKENSSVVEQASCLFMTEVQKENSSVVEQASCLFMTLSDRGFLPLAAPTAVGGDYSANRTSTDG